MELEVFLRSNRVRGERRMGKESERGTENGKGE